MICAAKFPTRLVYLVLVCALSGCTAYHALPLSDRPDLVSSLDQIVENVPPGTVNVSDGVDMTEASVIAASMNPDLRAVRMKRNVARAEAFSAGLLPDPQVNATLDKVTTSGPGLLDGFSSGITFDLRAFLTHDADKAAAESKAKGVDMDVLWQEWQVIQKARTLYVQKYYGAQKLALLRQMTALDKTHEQRSEKSLKAGDATLEQASADLTSLMDAEGQLRTQQRASLQTDLDMDALMGLAPGVAINIVPPGLPRLPPEAAVRKALETVSLHRPDLIALKAAYEGQEQTLYAAVLKQFPSISLGFNTARDTSNVHTIGLGVTMDLPVFNGNRGEVAVQTATRAQLHAEYQARLDQTQADIDTLWKQTQMIGRQLRELQTQMPRLEAMANKARKPYARGDFPALSYITLQSSLLSKKLEYLDLQQSLWTNRIGLDTLLAWPVPPAAKQGAPG